MGVVIQKGHLPPRPDPYTGEPRPPEAPSKLARPGKRRSARWARYPPAPEGCGPVLEWFQPAVGSMAVSVGLVTSGLLLVGVILFAGFHSLLQPQAVPVLVGGGVLSAAMVVGDSLLPRGLINNVRVSAGADWLAVPSGWVDTYELDAVAVQGTLVPDVVLTDSAGRMIQISVADLQANQRLWDLVHNGLLHSDTQGAVISDDARTWLFAQ